MSSKAEKAKKRKDQKEKAKGSEASAAVADGALRCVRFQSVSVGSLYVHISHFRDPIR